MVLNISFSFDLALSEKISSRGIANVETKLIYVYNDFVTVCKIQEKVETTNIEFHKYHVLGLSVFTYFLCFPRYCFHKIIFRMIIFYT